MAIEYCVICDECGTVIDGSKQSSQHVRDRAQQEGTLVRYKGKDYCAYCSELKLTEAERFRGKDGE